MTHCCVRNSVTSGDHSEHCAKNTRHHSKPSKMGSQSSPEPEDIGQGEGCEGGKCEIREKP